MSWFNEKSDYTFFQKVCLSILKRGYIPSHVSIIMDGNRRYAQKKSIKKIEGHRYGFDKLSETLKWCRDLNIKEVSVFAFSINNFKRESEEVIYLMNMVREKFMQLITEMDLLEKYDVCVRVIGNLSLLPPDIQDLSRTIIKLTAAHKTYYLNICVAYTSHDEIRHSLNQIKWGIENKLIEEQDISEDLVNKCMYMRNSPKVNLTIRTSGESRLSDFLMWQTDKTCIRFCDSYWPEFSVWNLFSAILKYQTNYLWSFGYQNGLTIDSSYGQCENIKHNNRINEFLLKMENKFTDWLYNGTDGYFIKDQ